jgi:hemolysin III
MKKNIEYSNTITASIGMLLSYIGFIYIIMLGMKYGNYWNLFWSVIYGVTLILLHTSSTFYHGAVNPNIKKKFRLMDHSCIYLLIAGTYTPIALINLYGAFGISIFSIIWLLSILGIFLKIKGIQPFKNFEVFLYLFMGWFALIGIKELINVMDINGIILIFSGGLFFTIGLFFYIGEISRYSHAFWHLFYISGCICHYLAIVSYTIPYKI